MAALSMVIIAAIIGGTADIGWEVLYYVRKLSRAEFSCRISNCFDGDNNR